MYTLTIKSIVLEDKGEYICERVWEKGPYGEKIEIEI